MHISTWAKMLTDRDLGDQYRARIALLRIGDEAVPHIEKLLNGKDHVAQGSAARLLGEMAQQSKVAMAALVRGIHSSDRAVRVESISGLGLAGANALPELEQLVNDADVGDAARQAIAQIKNAKPPPRR
jgi:HEAT repeat protein